MAQSLNGRLKPYNKITYRISFLFGAATLLSMIVIGYYGYNNASNAYLKNSIITSKENVIKLSSVLEGYMQPTISDVSFFTDFYALKQFIHWRNIGEKSEQNTWRDVTIAAFTSFLISKKRYYKIRYIDSQGQETIRLNYNAADNSVSVTPEKELQNKIQRNYFQETMALDIGTLFVSPFNLNREFGKIEFPYQPTIRFSMPIIDHHGQRKGIIVVNMIGNKILDKISEHDNVLSEDDFLLLNNRGYYIYHADARKRFGFDLGYDETINKQYPLLFKDMHKNESGHLIENGEIISYAHIHLGNNIDDSGNFLVVVNKIPQSFALEKLHDFELAFIFLVGVIFVVIFFIARWITQILSPLESVAEHLHMLSEGQIPTQRLPRYGDDEVGLIVSSTNQLFDSISATINQANAIASGDFSRQVLVRSEKDELNIAINAMTRRLADVAVLAERLSKGNYTQEIQIFDRNDSLGIALQNMLHYLSEIAKVAESVALGDFNYIYKLASHEDRLGLAVTQMQETLRSVVSQANAIAKGDFTQSIVPRSDKDELGEALRAMTRILASTKEKNNNDLWLNDGISLFSKKLSGVEEPDELAELAIKLSSEHINAVSGVLYFFNKDSKTLELRASYAHSHQQKTPDCFNLGDGVIGQVALEMKPILLHHASAAEAEQSASAVQSDLLKFVQTGTSRFEVLQTYTFPLIHEDKIFGVAEMALIQPITQIQKDYLNQAASVFATVLNAAEQNVRIRELLDKSQHDYDELQKKSEELQQVSQYKSEFLANMSHELRTPLNSIILLSKMLSNGLESADQIKKAKVIHNAGNDLLLLINDILDLSKVEAGLMEITTEEVTAGQIIANLEDLFNPVAQNNSIDFVIQNEVQQSFKTDSTKVIQVLKNLLSNAFKFTRQGSITLHIYKQQFSLCFAVIDTGVGIPVDKINNIFDAFKQVDGSISREYGGTGLGLSISLSFARLLRGELLVESKEGQGSTFILKIPEILSGEEPDSDLVAQTVFIADKKNAAADNQLSLYTFDGETILLVDDDPRNIFTLSALFQEAGAQTMHALNGEEALQELKVSAKVVDLILMDIMMPKMNGYEAIQAIRSNKQYDHIPIIAVTAKAMAQDRQKCLDAGANDYIIKPIDDDSLLKISRDWIDKKKNFS